MAIRRIAENVLAVGEIPCQKIETGTDGAAVRGTKKLRHSNAERIFTPRGIPETAFLAYLYPLYGLLIAWRRKGPDCSGLATGTEPDLILDALDRFSHRHEPKIPCAVCLAAREYADDDRSRPTRVMGRLSIHTSGTSSTGICRIFPELREVIRKKNPAPDDDGLSGFDAR